MCLTKTTWVSLLILAAALPFLAQEPIIEYGRPDELRGVTRVFVDTGIDAQQREVIVREIQKQLPDLEIASRPEESDVHLRFFQKETRPRKNEGQGSVVKLLGSNRVRVLFSFKDDTPPIFDRDSIVSSAMDFAKPHVFARVFVKVYRKANG